MKRRRTILGLLLFASANLSLIALYQAGILKRLPGPHRGPFDAERVNGSKQAYSLLSTPDGFLGLASYSISACLTAAGGELRAQLSPLVPLCMSAKLFADAVYAGKLTIDSIVKFRALSIWSLMAAAATWIAAPLTFPESRAAFRNLRLNK